MKLAVSFFSLPPNSHRTALLESVSVFTRNDVIRARESIGRATSVAIRSGNRSARDFGTSSPRTRDRYAIGNTTRTMAIGSAQLAIRGHGRLWMMGFREAMAAAPPI